MSWKSIVIAGLLCVLAAPSFAATVSGKLLGLDTAGNWVWELTVDPDQTTFVDEADTPDRGVGGSEALEVGIQATGRGVVSAAANTTNFPSPTVGNGPAGWNIITGSVSALHPNGISDVDDNDVEDLGVVFNTTTDRVIAFLGSDFFGSINFGGTNGDPKAAFRVHTEGPTTAALTTGLTLSGAYTAGGVTGGALPLIAENELQTGFTLGPLTKSVLGGNTNLDGIVNAVDGGELVTRWQQAGALRWQDGDFNHDGVINAVDGGEVVGHWQAADPNWAVSGTVGLPLSPGAGGGAGIVAPEPSTFVLLGLGWLVAALGRRRQ